MKTWEEFIEWLNGFNKIDTRIVYVDSNLSAEESRTVEARPFSVEGDTEQEAKEALIFAVTDELGDGSSFNVWIRSMPEVNKQLGWNWVAKSRIAYFPKGL